MLDQNVSELLSEMLASCATEKQETLVERSPNPFVPSINVEQTPQQPTLVPNSDISLVADVSALADCAQNPSPSYRTTQKMQHSS